VPKAAGVVGQLSLVNLAIKTFLIKIFGRYFFENPDRYIFSKKKLDRGCPIFNSLHTGILGFAQLLLEIAGYTGPTPTTRPPF